MSFPRVAALVVTLIARASAQVAQKSSRGPVVNPPEWENGRIRHLDSYIARDVEATGRLAFVKLDPVGCPHGIQLEFSCGTLHRNWGELAQQFPFLLWHADCRDDADLCAARGVPAGATEPIFDAWTGQAWVRYKGPAELLPLMQFVSSYAFLTDYDAEGWVRGADGTADAAKEAFDRDYGVDSANYRREHGEDGQTVTQAYSYPVEERDTTLHAEL